jgi:hypothetical protein
LSILSGFTFFVIKKKVKHLWGHVGGVDMGTIEGADGPSFEILEGFNRKLITPTICEGNCEGVGSLYFGNNFLRKLLVTHCTQHWNTLIQQIREWSETLPHIFGERSFSFSR